jgi:hypothetical protein
MSPASADPIDRVLDPLARCLTPDVARRMLSVEMDPVTRQHLDQLAAKANEGTLTEDERAEYEEYVDAIDFVGILQAKARAFLSEPAPG